jgi:outer membrane protein
VDHDPSDLSEINRLVDSFYAERRPTADNLRTTISGNDMRQTLGFCNHVIVSASALVWTSSAAAQTLTKIEPPLTAAPAQTSGYPSEPAGQDGGSGEDHVTIGVGGLYRPAYMGSSKYQFQPIPAIDIKRARFFVNFQNGIGVAPVDNAAVTAGIGIVMVTDNYERKDVPNQFNKIDIGAGARGFVSVRQFGLEATAGLTQIFAGGTKGMIADFSLSRPIVVNDRLFLTPAIGTRWANAKHNDRFYGVTAGQAQASGLRQFRPGSGLLDAKAELGLQYRLTDHIGFGATGGVTTLLGKVKDSPIVRKKTAPFGMGFLTYTF